jgi:transposase-like protein
MKTARTRAEWRELVRLLDVPGATPAAVAAAHGVSARTLTWWRSQFRREAAAKPGAKQAGPIVVVAPRFAQVGRADEPASAATPETEAPSLVLEVGAVRIAVSRAFDRALLAQILEVLGVRSAR